MLYQDHGSYMLVLSDSLASRIYRLKDLLVNAKTMKMEKKDQVAAAAAAATFWIDFGDMVLGGILEVVVHDE
ncbi:hypothetical protein CTI12_AA578120 [Artemisia annua]|uniref:Uncharacterized protein n=1 Tax=Artemisia annua TaxID=35608 RepID=A0A2U1KPV8_ARTAN|nr:hypothetical protein CTI12_AA578120 [Artemisia annua]